MVNSDVVLTCKQCELCFEIDATNIGNVLCAVTSTDHFEKPDVYIISTERVVVVTSLACTTFAVQLILISTAFNR